MRPYWVRASHVARVSHPVSSCLKYLAVIAYLDESGDPAESRAFTLAGWVATEQQWKTFETKWMRILRRYKLFRVRNGEQQYCFHMADFRSRQPPFDKLTESQRVQCISQLAAIIKNTIVYGFSFSMNVESYNEVVKPHIELPRERGRGYYVFLLQMWMEWLTENLTIPRGERVALVCDRKDWVRALASEHYFKLVDKRGWDGFFGGLNFQNKLLFPGLQAADMLAYEGYQERLRNLDSSNEPQSKLLANLAASGKVKLTYYDEASFRSFLAQVPEFSTEEAR